MQYVPSFPSPASPLDTDGVKPVSHAQQVRAITQSVTPPVVFTHYRAAVAAGKDEERDAERRFRLDRRAICRRIGNERDKLLLLDSRAELERRRNSRRPADVRTNIDEEI